MIKPFVLLSDIHLHNWSQFSSVGSDGINSRLKYILVGIRQAADELLAAGGKRMYIAGDLLHVRGSIRPSVINPTLDLFREMLLEGIEVRLIPGNHDLESNESNYLSNACMAIAELCQSVCNEPQHFSDDNVVMIPWIPRLKELRAEMKQWAERYPGADCIIHAPLNGVIKGIPDHGLDATELAKLGFKRVFVGHYHNHVSFPGGIHSIGALTHQTWSDVNSKAGFLMVDDTSVSRFETHAPKFVNYDETLDEEELMELCEGNFVRVQLGEASEKEILEIREGIMREHRALGCVVNATPKPKTPTRAAGGIKSGARVESSIEDWIKSSDIKVDHKAVIEDSLEVLREADAAVND